MFVIIILKDAVIRQLDICMKKDYHVEELIEISQLVIKETWM